ncbi:hypothetical protein BDR26DRAFT_969210 [Obelidium mucronatum]|nr:hypothetical protein BDR26DRAFT_969210 [Obelidium mucronatum]
MLQHCARHALSHASILSKAAKRFPPTSPDERITVILNDDGKSVSHARFVMDELLFKDAEPYLRAISAFGRGTKRKDGLELICLWRKVQDGIANPHYTAGMAKHNVSIKQSCSDGEYFNLDDYVRPELAETIRGLRPLVEDLQSITQVLMGSEATECLALIHRELARYGEIPFPGFTACFATAPKGGRSTSGHLDPSNHPFSVGVMIAIYSDSPTPRGVLPMLYLTDSDTWVNLKPNKAVFVAFQDKKHVVRLYPPEVANLLTPEEIEVCWAARTSIILTESLRSCNAFVKENPQKFARFATVVKNGGVASVSEMPNTVAKVPLATQAHTNPLLDADDAFAAVFNDEEEETALPAKGIFYGNQYPQLPQDEFLKPLIENYFWKG